MSRLFMRLDAYSNLRAELGEQLVPCFSNPHKHLNPCYKKVETFKSVLEKHLCQL